MSDPVAATRATYDEIAPRYVRESKPFPELADDIAWLIDVVGADAAVAEIGCGPGRDLRALRAAGLRVVGFDLSAAQLRAGGLDGGAAPVVVADMRALPLRTAAVDALWCQAALLHIPHAYVPETLAGFARVVRPGGAIYLSVNEGDGEGWQSSGFDRARWYTGHREDGLRTMLPAAGFEVTYVRHTTTNRDWLSVRARRR